jgi:hypothetical protein
MSAPSLKLKVPKEPSELAKTMVNTAVESIEKQINKGNNKMSIKNMVGKKVSKTTKFMGEDIKISKLSVSEVMEIQNKAKAIDGDETQGLQILRVVIRSAVEGGSDLSDEDFEGFPMEELSKLSGEIMKFSGIGADAGK